MINTYLDNRRRMRNAAGLAAAVCALLIASPAGAGTAGYGGPGEPPLIVHGVRISTTFRRSILIRMHVARRYYGKPFRVMVNGKLVAHGHVSLKGKILTVFGTKHNRAASRGAVLVIKVGNKIVAWIRR